MHHTHVLAAGSTADSRNSGADTKPQLVPLSGHGKAFDAFRVVVTAYLGLNTALAHSDCRRFKT